MRTNIHAHLIDEIEINQTSSIKEDLSLYAPRKIKPLGKTKIAGDPSAYLENARNELKRTIKNCHPAECNDKARKNFLELFHNRSDHDLSLSFLRIECTKAYGSMKRGFSKLCVHELDNHQLPKMKKLKSKKQLHFDAKTLDTIDFGE